MDAGDWHDEFCVHVYDWPVNLDYADNLCVMNDGKMATDAFLFQFPFLCYVRTLTSYWMNDELRIFVMFTLKYIEWIYLYGNKNYFRN